MRMVTQTHRATTSTLLTHASGAESLGFGPFHIPFVDPQGDQPVLLAVSDAPGHSMRPGLGSSACGEDLQCCEALSKAEGRESSLEELLCA
jgi:hypothetical protein